jgi:hypothetical protein
VVAAAPRHAATGRDVQRNVQVWTCLGVRPVPMLLVSEEIGQRDRPTAQARSGDLE